MSEAERIEWDSRHSTRRERLHEPEPFVVGAVTGIESPGTAVDLAGGTGRHGIWAARHGWEVTLADISPTALEIAVSDSADAAVALSIWLGDLDDDFPPQAPFDLAIIHHYLNRSLLGGISARLVPGGHLVMAHPTLVNLERNDRPGRAFLLEPDELPQLLPGLDQVHYFEGWTAQGRHEAQVVARRPAHRL